MNQDSSNFPVSSHSNGIPRTGELAPLGDAAAAKQASFPYRHRKGIRSENMVLMLIHDTDVTISDRTTGEIIRKLTIDPTKDYQARESGQRKHPGPKTGV